MMFVSICRACLSRLLVSKLGYHSIGPRNYAGKAGMTVQDKTKRRKYRPIPKGEYLFGHFPILLAIQQGKRDFHWLFLKDTFQYTLRDDIKALIRLAEEKSIKIKYFNHQVLNELSGGRPHQGVCADVSPRHFLQHPSAEVDSESLQREPKLWLFLDSIKDPMNFGAVLRSSYYFGVDRIITTETNSCGLTSIVSKASAGAMEILDIYSVPNSAEFIQGKINQNWRVLGTGVEAKRPSVELSQCAFDADTLLILGNEGEGLSSHLTSLCHQFVSIQSRRHLSENFDSLNVSVATGILLHHFLGKKTVM